LIVEVARQVFANNDFVPYTKGFPRTFRADANRNAVGVFSLCVFLIAKCYLLAIQLWVYCSRMQLIKEISMSSLQAEMLVEQKVANGKKSTGVAYLLWFFLGGFGGHRFYLGKTGTAAVQLVITLIGCFTLFPLIITGIWLLIDAFLIPAIVREHAEEVRHRARLEVSLIQQG